MAPADGKGHDLCSPSLKPLHRGALFITPKHAPRFPLLFYLTSLLFASEPHQKGSALFSFSIFSSRVYQVHSFCRQRIMILVSFWHVFQSSSPVHSRNGPSRLLMLFCIMKNLIMSHMDVDILWRRRSNELHQQSVARWGPPNLAEEQGGGGEDWCMCIYIFRNSSPPHPS